MSYSMRRQDLSTCEESSVGPQGHPTRLTAVQFDYAVRCPHWRQRRITYYCLHLAWLGVCLIALRLALPLSVSLASGVGLTLSDLVGSSSMLCAATATN